jgi:TPR repeat protein
MALTAVPAMAEAPAPTPADLFQKLCVATNARTEAVEASARAAGFVATASPQPMPEGTSKAVTMTLDTATGRLALVAATGEAQITTRLPARVKTHTCGLTVPGNAWDARGYARTWLGIAPLFDMPDKAIYSYAQRPQGNVVADDDKDMAGYVAALNAGQLRFLIVAERGPVHGLTWMMFDAPDHPAAMPAPAAPVRPVPSMPAYVVEVTHDGDPFTPCTWKTRGKGSAAYKVLDCPGDENGAPGRGFTEATPAQAQQGDTTAMLRMAYFYLDGPLAVRDQSAGRRWAHRAAEAGSAQGAFDIGLAHDRGTAASDKAEAATWYRKAAEGGDTSAMINLAALQLGGSGMASDEAAAAGWVRKAAEAGATDAMLDMGWLSARGLGVPQDDAAALRWYRLAADKKDAAAKYRIGVMYADGTGVARNDAEAARWLVDGAKSLLDLVALVNNVNFFIADQRALSAYADRARAGDAKAAMQLGLFLADARGGHYDPAKALPLLRIAADAGIPIAMLRLGTMYARGEGVTRNDAEAIRWLRAGGRAHDAGVEGFRRIKGFFSPP